MLNIRICESKLHEIEYEIASLIHIGAARNAAKKDRVFKWQHRPYMTCRECEIYIGVGTSTGTGHIQYIQQQQGIGFT